MPDVARLEELEDEFQCLVELMEEMGGLPEAEALRPLIKHIQCALAEAHRIVEVEHCLIAKTIQ